MAVVFHRKRGKFKPYKVLDAFSAALIRRITPSAAAQAALQSHFLITRNACPRHNHTQFAFWWLNRDRSRTADSNLWIVRRHALLESLIGFRQTGARSKIGVGGPANKKPTIGLALGGGAARGFAHIGILRTLLANGIVPDIVVGTSIGAVVGASYAAGHLDTLESWAKGLLPRNIFSYLDIRLNGSGLIGGSKLAAQLESSFGGILIDELPLKFAAVSTEVNTGHEIWITDGRLVDAVRASYALPGIFEPVLIGDRWLVDGALVNPVPVSAARALGAEVVIACNVSTDVFGHGTIISAHGKIPVEPPPEQPAEPVPEKRGFGKFFSAEKTVKREFFGSAGRPGISTVMVEAFNIMQDRITRSRLAGDPPDVLISPRVGKIGWFDFHRAEETIAHGARAAERNIESIQEAISLLTPTASQTPGTAQPTQP
jgi:NTE family protein